MLLTLCRLWYGQICSCVGVVVFSQTRTVDCGVISQRIFQTKISLERSCNGLNEIVFIVVIGLVVVEVWVFETKNLISEWKVSLHWQWVDTCSSCELGNKRKFTFFFLSYALLHCSQSLFFK